MISGGPLSRHGVLFVLAIAALPIVPLAARLPGALVTDYSVGDLASFEIGVFESTLGERLVGMPARFGFHQLGPAHFWVQAPLYAATGHERYALSLTALILNWSAFLALLYVLARHGQSWSGALMLPIGAVGFLGYYESATLFNYWPNYQNVLPFALLIASAAVAASGKGCWPLVIALASYVVQGYGSNLPAVVALVLVAACIRWISPTRARLDASPPLRWVTWGATLAVAAIFWLPTLIEEWRHDPGNLALMASHYRAPGRAPAPGLAASAVAIAPHLAVPWLHLTLGATVNTVLEPPQLRAALLLAVVLVAALAATALAAARARRQWASNVSLLILVAIAAALGASRQSDGPIPPNVFFWLASAAALGWIVVLGFWLDRWTAGLRFGAWLTEHRAYFLTASVLVLTLSLLVRPIPIPRLGDPSVAAFDRALTDRLLDPRFAGRPVHLVSHDFAWVWSLGVLVELAKQEVPVSIANVQGTTKIPHLQGLMPRWLERRPASVEVHLFDRDPGEVAGRRKLLCHPVLLLDQSKPTVCMHISE